MLKDPGVAEITNAIHNSSDKIATVVETTNHTVAETIVKTEDVRYRKQRMFMIASLITNLLLLVILACFSFAFFSYAIVVTTR